MLLSLSETKEFLQITATSTDSLITLYISLIQGEVDSYLNRKLEQTTYTNESLFYKSTSLDLYEKPSFEFGEDLPQLFLDEYPVSSLTLKYDGSTISTSKYRLDSKNGTITLYEKYDDQEGKITADFTAGYVTNTTSTYALPAELKLVMLEGVKQLYENNKQAKQGAGDVKSKSIDNFSVTYGNEQSGTSMTINQGNSQVVIKRYLAQNSATLNRYKKLSV